MLKILPPFNQPLQLSHANSSRSNKISKNWLKNSILNLQKKRWNSYFQHQQSRLKSQINLCNEAIFIRFKKSYRLLSQILEELSKELHLQIANREELIWLLHHTAQADFLHPLSNKSLEKQKSLLLTNYQKNFQNYLK